MEPHTQPLRSGQPLTPAPAVPEACPETHSLRSAPSPPLAPGPETPLVRPLSPMDTPTPGASTPTITEGDPSLPAFALQFLQTANDAQTASVRKNSPASAPVTAPTPAVETICPQCGHGPLISPTTLGLCSRCGFCRSLEDDRETLLQGGDEWVVPIRQATPAILIDRIPAWGWILALGAAAIIAGSVLWLSPLKPSELPLACVTQLGVGIVVLWLAQWWALLRVAPTDSQLGAGDVLFISGRLWLTMFRGLPATRWQVLFGVWGLLIAVCAVIGSLGWWMS